MKKNELKNALGRIRPREQLIQNTLARIDAQREREATRTPLFSPAWNKGVRLAGAFCAIALVIGIGVVALRSNRPAIDPPPITRSLAELQTTDVETVGFDLAALTVDEDAPNGWIIVSGKSESLIFEALREGDAEAGITSRAKVCFAADKMLERSESLIVDLEKEDPALTVHIAFYGQESADRFSNAAGGDLLLKLTPDGQGNWLLIDFAPLEN